MGFMPVSYQVTLMSVVGTQVSDKRARGIDGRTSMTVCGGGVSVEYAVVVVPEQISTAQCSLIMNVEMRRSRKYLVL